MGSDVEDLVPYLPNALAFINEGVARGEATMLVGGAERISNAIRVCLGHRSGEPGAGR